MIEFLQQVFNGLAIGAVYTLIAIGLTIVFGILGIAHFAHGVVAMSGGYVTFFFNRKIGRAIFCGDDACDGGGRDPWVAR